MTAATSFPTAVPAVAALFRPITLAGLPLPNRTVVAPLTRVSATPDGRATGEMVDYYRAYARGGWGLIVSEATWIDSAFSQGYLRQPGIARPDHIEAWRLVTDAVHAEGARMVLQLSHAGALGQGNPHRSGTVAPSAIRPAGEIARRYRGQGPYPLPRALQPDEIAGIIAAFAQAAAHAIAASFDGVEIHGANGYLIHQFLAADSNARGDDYGGDLDGRLRFPLAVLDAVRAVVPRDRLLGIRLSQSRANDATAVWQNGAGEAAAIFAAMGQVPDIYLHVSSHTGCAPVFGTPLSLAGLARAHSGHPVIANGKLDVIDDAVRMVADGEADLISVGKAALADPAWAAKIARGAEPVAFDPGMISPVADLPSRQAWDWARG